MYEEARYSCPLECKKLAADGGEFVAATDEVLTLNDRRIRNVEILRRRRKSGFELSEAQMTAIEYEALLIFDEIAERFEQIILDEQDEIVRAFLIARRGF